MSGMLGGGSGVSTTRYAGMQVSTSLQGQVIPYITGRTRVPMNLIWYGNFKSSGAGSGKGGGAPSSWTYSAAWIAALGLGPLTGIFNVYYDKSVTTLTLQNLAFALGTTGQAVWSGYPSTTPAQQKIPYSGIGYVATNLFQFGSSPSMPNFTFEVEGVVPGFSDAHAMFDSDFAAVIPDYLQSAVHGAGFQGTIAPLTGVTNTFQSYCMSLGLMGSLNEDTQRASTDAMKEVMQITNSDSVLSCGTLKVIPYADTAVSGTTPDGTSWSYTPNLTPIFSFTDGDYCPKQGDEPVKLTRKALKDTYNVVNVEVLDATNQYNPAPVTASDNWDISLNGPRVMATITLHQITNVAVGKMVAQLILQQQLYDRNSWEFRVRADYCLLEPMDIVSLTDAIVGLNQKLVRISKIEDDGDNYFTITAMEVTGTTRNAPQYNWAANAGYTANYDAAPGSVATPAIFQMPSIPGALSEGITLGIAVCGPTSAAFWGGAQVYCSADAGTTYEWVGTIGQNGPARYGALTANVTAVADPDTTNTLSLALANTNLQLSTAVTHADADSNQTMILVGSGSTAEVMSYGTGALVSAGNYNLTYLRRDLYGSANSAHSSGAQFVRLDGAIFQLPIDPGAAGQTLLFKFTSYNAVGRAVEQLSAVTAYSYTVPNALPVGGAPTLVPRGSCAISGQTIYKATIGSNAWDSDASSIGAYGSVSISGQYSSGGALAIGLASSVSSVINPASATNGFYGFYAHADATQTNVVDNGSVIFTGATPAKNDLYQVTYDGFTIRYFLNGVMVISSQHQGLQLYEYVTLFEPGCIFSNVETTVGALATPAQWIATGNCVANDSNAMKQGGATAWDSAVYSVIGYKTCHIVGRVNAAGGGANSQMIGLATVPAPTAANVSAGTVFDQANYAWDNGTGGSWAIFESGTNVGSFAAVSTSDIVAILYDGSTVTYLLNGVSQRTVSVSGLTLYGFCPFWNAGGAIDQLNFGSGAYMPLIGTASSVPNLATDPFVLSAPADGNTVYAATTQPVIEVPGINASPSYASPAAFATQVTVAWTAQGNISNATSGGATGTAEIFLTVQINGSTVYTQFLSIEGNTGASWGTNAGTQTFAVPAGQTLQAFLNSGRKFTTGGASPAQTINWRGAVVNIYSAKR